jgi:hypothetical protein
VESKATAKFKMGANGMPSFDEGLADLPGGQAEKSMTKANTVLFGCRRCRSRGVDRHSPDPPGAMSFPPQVVESNACQFNISASASGLNVNVGFDTVIARKGSSATFYLLDLGTPNAEPRRVH